MIKYLQEAKGGNFMQKNLEKYAKLLVRNGLNIQKDQLLVVNAPIEAAEFVRIVAKQAYDEGAKNVHVEYRDEELALVKYLNAPFEAFKEAMQWKADGFEQMASENAAFLSITGTDPDLFKDVDPERIAEANKTNSKSMEKFRKYTLNSKVSWCVAAVPSPSWAKKIFPDETTENAIEKLWDKIFIANRVYDEDPVISWDNHIKNLTEKVEFLNNNQFKSLHYKSAKTDLVVELPENHVWAGGGEYNESNVYFVANMPTEEVFTMPLKTGVNGYLTSTFPLNYSGSLIDNFKLTFKEGRIIEVEAETGLETLKKLIDTDEGSHYLGEVALVPYDSPINNTGIVFYNTLFDENASCHFALGAAYPTNIVGGDKMTDEELEQKGANTSLTHVDFMIGSKDMNIVATKHDGTKVQIFKDGDWAF